jgi:hypothetical protein
MVYQKFFKAMGKKKPVVAVKHRVSNFGHRVSAETKRASFKSRRSFEDNLF